MSVSVFTLPDTFCNAPPYSILLANSIPTAYPLFSQIKCAHFLFYMEGLPKVSYSLKAHDSPARRTLEAYLGGNEMGAYVADSAMFSFKSQSDGVNVTILWSGWSLMGEVG